MDYYVDPSATGTTFVNWANYAPYEPERRQSPRPVSLIERPTSISGASDFFDPVAGPSAPTAQPSRVPARAVAQVLTTSANEVRPLSTTAEASDINVEVERIAKQRVRLMAAKYASGKESKELVARLEILNSRLLDRSPRVSAGQVQALEFAASQLAQARHARDERRKRLGIEA